MISSPSSISRYTAKMMRKDMAEYDMDNTKYTQSLGCWHGFVAQQKLISVKKHFGTTEKRYIYLIHYLLLSLSHIYLILYFFSFSQIHLPLWLDDRSHEV